MFIDSVKLNIASGDGGKGAVSFRREKHVLLGGPDGGDGGDGGDVYFVCDNNLHTLLHFKGKKEFKASNGVDGQKRNKSGKKGEDLELRVPAGTQVIDSETKELLLDLQVEGQKELFLKGGIGGKGNTYFKSPTNQVPQYAQQGKKGLKKTVNLELKLIADVGLVGFPNVGKSTLISVLSNARPEIANYEFTTLTPKLGLVRVDEYDSFVMADIPGIIEGASVGKGLGLKFLKHIERTNFLLFLLDISREMSLKTQFQTLQKELQNFSAVLAKKSFAVLLSKTDLLEDEYFKAKFDEEKKELEGVLGEARFVSLISSLKQDSLTELKFKLYKELKA